MAANYANVNAVWPDHAPAPSPQEALTGARKLVRLALTLGREGSLPQKYRGKFALTSGVRRCWTRNRTFYVNPDNTRGFHGWKGIVHDISHWAGRRLYRDYSPHDHRHAFIERTLAEHVVRNGWLDGKLKREPKPKPEIDRIALRAARIEARIKAWETKRRRAENALAALRKKQRYYRLAKASPVRAGPDQTGLG